MSDISIEGALFVIKTAFKTDSVCINQAYAAYFKTELPLDITSAAPLIKLHADDCQKLSEAFRVIGEKLKTNE